MPGSSAVSGGVPEAGRCRIEDEENPDAWIEAEYRDGWVERKLVGTESEEYHDMIHPFYQRCAFCREWDDPQLWGRGSPYCPLCEQWHEFTLPHWMAELFGAKGDFGEEIEI